MKKSFFQLPENMSTQARSAFQIAAAIAVAHFLAGSHYLYVGWSSGTWQFLALAAISFALGLLIVIGAVLSRREQPTLGIILVLGALTVSYPPIAMLVIRLGSVLGLALMVVGPMSAIQILPRRTSWVMTLITIIGGLATLLLDVFGSTTRPVLAGIFIPFLALLVVSVVGFFVFRIAWGGSLRTKLLTSFLSTIVLTIASFTVFALYSASQTQTLMFDQLETAVRSQSRQQIKETGFAATLDAEETFSEMVKEVEKLAEYHAALYAQSSTLEQGAYWDANARLRKLPGGQYDNPNSDIASVFVPSTIVLDEAIIANINTGIYLDFTAPTILQSNPNIVAIYFIGTDGSTIYYPNINLAEVVPPDFDPRLRPFYSIATPEKNPERKVVWTDPYQDAAGNGLLVTASTSVYDQAGKFRGVIAMDVQLIDISTNVAEIKAGESGFAFLVDSSGRLIGMSEAGYKFFNLTPEVVPVEETPKLTILGVGPLGLQEVSRKMTAGETGLEIITVQGEEYYVSYAPLSSLDYSLGVVAPVAELDVPYLTARDQFENQAQDSNRVFVTILVVILLAAIGASLLLSQFLSGPIVRLTKVAEQVTAGDMEAQAKVESADEIGALAGAFNGMTSQLREFIGTLESRVAERTRNIELAAEVGHTVSQVRALDVMLTDAAELIRSRFDLYYVQVYLTDPTQTNLLLQSGTGAVGTELMGRGHRLPLNTASINGRAAVEKQAVVISDTTASASFKPNPLLPNTRSEMAVPLLIGEKVVGVLDMQSEHAGSLSQDILPAFEALAGQLAIAIQNATLLAETEQARAEVETQARRLSRANWTDFLDAIHKPEETGFVFEQNKIAPMTQAEQSQSQTNVNALTAPIAVTGETLGNLVVEMGGQSPISRISELVDTVARQVAQQIESLRLLDSAERYRFEAEEASRRLTREGWKSYVDNANESMSYVYDLREVRLQNNNGDQQVENTGYSLPLKVRDETIGKMIVQGLDASDGEGMSLANAVAERLGTHIESLRQFAETQRGQIELDKRAQQLAAVAEVSTVSSQELDVQKMLESVVFLTQRKFGLYHAHVFLYNENTEELRIAACGWKEGDEHEGTHGTTTISLQQEQSLVARAARTRTAVIVNDVRNEPGWLPNPLLPDTYSEMAVPLLLGDQVLGVMDVQSDKLNAFTQEDANIQATLAAQIATSLQNARTFTQAQRQAERESALNTISQKIQSATTVEAVLQIAARELGHALGAPMTIAQLSTKDKRN